jgi:hypothetical protein
MSLFAGHATANDMLKHFTTGVLESGLKPVDMVQISMDGPNVNWKFYDMVKDKLVNDYDTKLMNVGSCGLHTIHNRRSRSHRYTVIHYFKAIVTNYTLQTTVG